MTSDIIKSILHRINQPGLLNILADELSGTELNSLLLEVFNRRTKSTTPAEMFDQYQRNRFVKPADLPVLKMKRMELDILGLFELHAFHPIELSPVSIRGSCSAVASVDQKKVLTALRGTEVLADSTNAMALHACDLRRKKMIPESPSTIWMRCSNIQRQLRTQTISGKGFRPHFRIGCLVSCGRDSGDFAFEKLSLREHMTVMKTLFLEYYQVDEVHFRLLRRDGYVRSDDLLQGVNVFLKQEAPQLGFTIVDRPEAATQYYQGIQYKVDIRVNGKTYEIADGGFVDWTQHLLQNKKERMLSTGFGFDLMYRILSGEL